MYATVCRCSRSLPGRFPTSLVFSPFFFYGYQYGTHYLVFPIKSIARRSSAILNCIELGRNGFFSAADIFLENIFFHLFLCFIIFHLPRRPTSERLVIWLLLGVRSFPRSRFVVSPLELKSNGALIKRADCDPIHSDPNWHFFFVANRVGGCFQIVDMRIKMAAMRIAQGKSNLLIWCALFIYLHLFLSV